jgi:hypothetical protein
MKKVIFFVVMAICVATTSAYAQVVNVENFAECKAYLNENPADTVFGKDSKGTDFAVYRTADGKIHRDTVKVVTVVKTDTVVIGTPKEVLAAVNSKAVNNLVNEKLIDKDGNRDAYVVQSSELANYQQQIGQSTKFDGNIPVGKAANKFGWGFGPYVGVGYSDSFKPLFGVEAAYTRRWWEAELQLGGSSREYTANSVNEGSYMTFRSSFKAGPSFCIGHYDTSRFSVLGGVTLETYKTDSKVDADGSYLRSSGSSLQGAVALEYAYRFFGTGNEMAVTLEYDFRSNVVQNANKEGNGTVSMTVAYRFGIARQKADYGKLPKGGANY